MLLASGSTSAAQCAGSRGGRVGNTGRVTNLRSPDGAVLHLPGRGRWPTRGWPVPACPDGPGHPPIVTLLLHGGLEKPDPRRVPAWWPPALRMIALGPALRRAGLPGSAAGPVITRLRYRAQGWNADGAEPVADARWALGRLRHHYPGSPVVLVGHSMGGRVGAALLADPAVIGLVGLAPWLPPGEPVPDLTDRRVVLIHGTGDRQIPPAQTREWAARSTAGTPADPDRKVTIDGPVAVVEIRGAGHSMLGRWQQWHRCAARALEEIIRAQGAG